MLLAAGGGGDVSYLKLVLFLGEGGGIVPCASCLRGVWYLVLFAGSKWGGYGTLCFLLAYHTLCFLLAGGGGGIVPYASCWQGGVSYLVLLAGRGGGYRTLCFLLAGGGGIIPCASCWQGGGGGYHTLCFLLAGGGGIIPCASCWQGGGVVSYLVLLAGGGGWLHDVLQHPQTRQSDGLGDDWTLQLHRLQQQLHH